MTDLIKKEIEPKEVFVPKGLDVILAGVQEKVTEFMAKTFDINKESHRKKISSFAYQVTRSKTFVDEKGKTYVAEIKKKTKEIDAERKRFRDKMDAHRDRIKEPVTIWEEAEKARIKAERELEIYLIEWNEAISENDIFNREKAIAEKEAEVARQEEEKRQKEEAERLEKEQAKRDERLKKEAIEKAELEAKAKIAFEKGERDRIEREAQEAKEQAEEKAKRDQEVAIQKAEQAVIDEANRKEQQRLDREKVEADKKAEAKRIADKKAANLNHRKAINKKILKSFATLGVKEDTGKNIIKAIIEDEIPEIKILY